MKKIIILVTMAILSASPAIYATSNLQYSETMHYSSAYMAPRVDYDGMAVPMISGEPTPYWDFPQDTARYTKTVAEGTGSDILHVTFSPVPSEEDCNYEPQGDEFYEGSSFATTSGSATHVTSCAGNCASGSLIITCDITFESGFFPRSEDYLISIEQTRTVYARDFQFESPELNAKTVFSTAATDPMFTPAAPLPSLPQPGTTSGSGTIDSIGDYSGFATDDGGCQLVAGAIANPFGFIILAMALIPLAWRRKK